MATSEGRNIIVEYRFGENSVERLPELATDLVRRNVNVIVSFGNIASRGARRAAPDMPVHDGKAIIESTLICEYLDDAFPNPRLVPADPWLRTRMRLWSKMVDEGLFEGVTEISFSAMFRERMRTISEEIRERRFRNIGDPRRRDRFDPAIVSGIGQFAVIQSVAPSVGVQVSPVNVRDPARSSVPSRHSRAPRMAA